MKIFTSGKYVLLSAALLLSAIGFTGARSAHAAGSEHVSMPDAQALQPSEKAKHDFVNHMAQDAISILYDQNRSFDHRKTTLENAFISVVDVPFIARFVLGRNWNAATPEQRERYTTLYRRYLTKTYISNFSEHPDKKIRDIKVRYIGETANEKYNVRTELVLLNGNTVKVDYVVRDKNDRYNVIDIAVEGISLLSSHRHSLGQLASEKGVDAVIARLEEMMKTKSFALADPNA
jgi:phospholipid transport system substrate-binding protein